MSLLYAPLALLYLTKLFMKRVRTHWTVHVVTVINADRFEDREIRVRDVYENAIHNSQSVFGSLKKCRFKP